MINNLNNLKGEIMSELVAIIARMTKKEREALKKKAAINKMSVSELMRTMANADEINITKSITVEVK